MQKIARYLGAFIFLASMVCLIGFWWGRTSGHTDLAIDVFGRGLTWTFYLALACIAYMLALGSWTIFRVWILGIEDEDPDAPPDAPPPAQP
ncbi:MAG: hypothetical protein ACYCWW_18975 [Deltaproteobacteria bacterium]